MKGVVALAMVLVSDEVAITVRRLCIKEGRSWYLCGRMTDRQRKTDGQRMACTYCTEKWMTPAFQHFSAHMNKA